MTGDLPQWTFPAAAGGRIHGFKEAGISTFSGDIMPSLVREICQNSLDAADTMDGPVRVEFERYDVPADAIPGWSDLAHAVGRAAAYWNKDRGVEVHEHIAHVARLLHTANSLSVLRCADFRTTGLKGAYSDEIDDWTRLTKLDGGATKSGVSAGSYGIGKNAPFAASALRMVFYRTLTSEEYAGGRAAQGIIHLPAFAQDVNRELSTQTLGIGYYGNPGGDSALSNQPVRSIPLLDELCPREEIGTDVFVFGFQNDRAWTDAVAAEVLESFLLAIFKGTLEVSVVDGPARVELTAQTLPDIVTRLAKKAKNAAAYYRVLTASSGVKCCEQEFHGLGTLRLQLLAGTEQPLNRKILVTRTNNMKIQAIDRMRGHLNFSGILELEGKELNKFFRALENPQHNGWESDRYTADPRKARQYMQELRNWVRDTVTREAATTTTEQMHVTGLSNNLRSRDSLDAQDGGSERPAPGPLVRLTVQSDQPGRESGQNVAVERTGGDAGTSGLGHVVSGSGQLRMPRQRTAGKRRKHRANGSADTTPGSAGGSKPMAVDLTFARLMQTGPGQARLILQPPRDIERGAVLLHIVGDNERSYRAERIRSAECTNAEVRVSAAWDRIRFEHLPGGVRTMMDLTLNETMPYALRVVLYEDQ